MDRISILGAISILCLFTVSGVKASELLAQVGTPPHIVKLETIGNSWDITCDLNLIVDESSISVKDNNYKCSMFGPIRIIATWDNDWRKAIIVIEGARGGDGDSTGPIIQIFRFEKKNIIKIGEQELFDAIYFRNKGVLTGISGKKLFGFCDVCDSWEVADEGDNIFVPVKIVLHKNNIEIRANIDKVSKANLIKAFDKQKKYRLSERSGPDPEYTKYVSELEDSFKRFIGDK